MICQNCGRAQATRHYKSSVNGEVQEAHLCADCARELGYEQMFEMPFSSFGFGVDSLLANFFGAPSRVSPASGVCPLCGSSLGDISSTGRLGCERCYDVFAAELDPFLRRMYGNAQHTGRIPKSAGKEIKTRRELERLRDELKAAVEAQEYERAAQLRDEIKRLEGEEKAL